MTEIGVAKAAFVAYVLTMGAFVAVLQAGRPDLLTWLALASGTASMTLAACQAWVYVTKTRKEFSRYQ